MPSTTRSTLWAVGAQRAKRTPPPTISAPNSMLWARRIGPHSSSLVARTGAQAQQGHLSWEKAPGSIRFPHRSYGGREVWQWGDGCPCVSRPHRGGWRDAGAARAQSSLETCEAGNLRGRADRDPAVTLIGERSSTSSAVLVPDIQARTLDPQIAANREKHYAFGLGCRGCGRSRSRSGRFFARTAPASRPSGHGATDARSEDERPSYRSGTHPVRLPFSVPAAVSTRTVRPGSGTAAPAS